MILKFSILLVCCSEEQSGLPRKDFHIFFVPRKSFLCEKRLKVNCCYIFAEYVYVVIEF